MPQTIGMDNDLDQALAAVGPRLRELRRQRETTLAGLSAATGISVSPLSRLESGARRPTLELLLPLARAHGVTLDELAGAPPTGDPRIHLPPVTRNGMIMLPLTRRAGGIKAFKVVIPATSRRTEPEAKTHQGYEWIYVLDGQLRLVLGEHDLVLSPAKRRSSTPGYRTGSAARVRDPSSSSACSARRASGRTCGRSQGQAASRRPG